MTLTGNETILILAEQGIGDVVQFARYGHHMKTIWPDLTLYFMVPEAVYDLVRGLPGFAQVMTVNNKTLPIDVNFQISLLSLPYLMHVHGHDEIPEIAPPLSDSLEEGLKLQSGLAIGICWRGNPDHPHDRIRSMPVAVMAELIRKIPIHAYYYPLHHDMTGDELDTLNEAAPGQICVPELTSWSKCRTIISQADLVISVDTAVAHIAGTLGVKVFTLLAKLPDWRWGLKSAFTPWYPSMQLFRQTKLGEWTDVIQEVVRELSHDLRQVHGMRAFH